ncbi:MAG: aldo/keto reductase, partial [Chitinophagaceae bacterium]
NDGIPEGSRFGLTGFDWLKDRWMKDDMLNKVKGLAALAKELGISMAELSIAWCIKNPNVTTAILGATKKEQLLENLKAAKAVEKLDATVMQQIEDIVQTKPVLPEH